MKKFVLIAVAVLVVLALGANWYYTREIRQGLDRLARTASMFGTLTYDSVRLSPAGEIHVNNLAFRPRGNSSQGVSVEQIAFRTGSLPALFTFQNRVESGQLPEELGIRIEGFEMSLDGAASTLGAGLASPAARRSTRGAGNTPATGAMFVAAGCGGRDSFSLDDLADMGYVRIDADIEAHYRIIDRGRRVRLSYRIRNREAGEFGFETTLDLMAGSLAAFEVMDAARRADLRSFSLFYRDLGFYERMIDFCADETGMGADEYIDHHIEGWVQYWAALGGRPETEVVDAYRAFVEQPEQFRVESRSDYTVSLDGIGLYSLPEFLQRMDTVLTVNFERTVPLALAGTDAVEATEPAEPEPDAGEQAGEDARPAEAATEAPERAGRAAPEVPDEPAGDRAGDAEPDAGAGTSQPRADRGWNAVEPSRLDAYIDRRVGVDMHSGRRFEGRLARIEADALHIRIQGVGGYYIRPLDRAEVEAVEVWHD